MSGPQPGTDGCASRVAFVIGGLYTEGSGVARIVCELADAVTRQGTRVDVLTPACGGRDGLAGRMLGPDVALLAPRGRGPRRLGWSPALRRLLDRRGADYSVIHNHSLWMLPNHYGSRAGRRHGRPVVFTVHGFLEPWALRRARAKKRFAALWFQNRDLRDAACIHVNSTSEVDGVRAYGLRNPVAIVPNGVSSSFLSSPRNPDPFLDAFPGLRNKRVCLFLSRLHEKKGLLPLLDAWARVQGDVPDWHLVLAGPDDGLGERVAAAVRTAPLEGRTTVTGPLFGEIKLSALDVAEAFVLPSYSEGFSMALLEALGRGLPVLQTAGCNFPEIRAQDAGVEVEPTVDGIGMGLLALLSATEAERERMGRSARSLVERGYTWDRVAKDMRALYGWLAGDGPPPVFVVR